MEGEAAIEIRIHYKHRQPQPYSCQSSQIGYDYPQGSQTVWFHGATTTPRPQSMVPTTGGPAMRVGGVGLPEGALDAATSSMAGPANPTAAASRENSYVESPSGYHSAPDSHRSATEMSSPRGGGGGGGGSSWGPRQVDKPPTSARSLSSSCEKALDADTIVEKEGSAQFPPRSFLSYLSSETISYAVDLSPRSVSDPVAVPVEVQLGTRPLGSSVLESEWTTASSTESVCSRGQPFPEVSPDKTAEAAADLLLATMDQSKVYEIASIGRNRSGSSPLGGHSGYLSSPRRKGMPLPAVVEEAATLPQQQPPTSDSVTFET